jgi:hypothetical protein
MVKITENGERFRVAIPPYEILTEVRAGTP